MRKLTAVLSIMLVMGMLYSCGDTTTTTAATNSLQTNASTGTLQGKIMDAVTGAPIANDPANQTNNTKIFLIQGDANRGPSKLVTDPNDPLVGEYSFSGIPIDLVTGNAVFKIVVLKPGYQRFEADVELKAGLNGNIIDAVINMIGNIYLFPLNTPAGDKQIYVYSQNGTPIPGAQLMILQNVENSNAIATSVSTVNTINPNGDRLNPTGGLYTSMTVTTDATGLATVSAANLVLGGSYKVVVPNLTFQGATMIYSGNANFFTENTVNLPLVINMDSNVNAGNQLMYVTDPNSLPVSGARIVLTMTTGQQSTMSVVTDANGVATINSANLVNNATYNIHIVAMTYKGQILKDSGAVLSFIANAANAPIYLSMTKATATDLFAVSASNELPGAIDATGKLTITFNQPIVMDTLTCNATITNSTTAIITSGTNTFAAGVAAPVTGTLSADNLTFTIQANITTAPTATSLGATITYSGCGNIHLKDSQTAVGSLFVANIEDIKTGNNINGIVQLLSF